MPELLVDFHLPTKKTGSPEGPHIDETTLKYDRPLLIEALVQRGAQPLISRDLAAYDLSSGEAHVFEPKLDFNDGDTDSFAISGLLLPRTVAIESVGAIRNIGGALNYGLPEVNHPRLRTLARDQNALDSLLSPLGFNPEIPADNTDALTRVYCFGRDQAGKLITHYVVRNVDLDTDNPQSQPWTIIDQDAIPAAIVEQTDAVVSELEAATDIAEMYIGLDWLSEDQLKVHGGDVLMVRARHHAETAAKLHGLLADQLVRVAERGGVMA